MPGETPLHACVGTWFSWNGHVIYSRPWALLGVTCYIRSLLPVGDMLVVLCPVFSCLDD